MSECVPIEVPALPNLPDGISLVPTLPKATLPIPNPCCLLPLPAAIKLSVPLPPGTVNTGLGTLMKTASKAAKTWLANIQPRCPRS